MVTCADDKAVTYALFAESGGSTEILGAMDTNLKSKELIFYGASCLVVLSCNEDLRTSLSEGDGISLIVDALHCHKKDDPTAVVLQALLVNLLHRNSAAKKAGVASNCIPIVSSILSGAHNRDKVLMSSLHVLRHLSAERDVRLAESKNRSQIFKEVIAAIVDNTQNEPIVAHGLWIFLNLMNGSHDNKSRFLGENGVALLESIAQDQQRNDSIMYLVSATYHQLLKVQRIRTELFAKHTLAHLKRNLETFSEPKPLIATYRALYAFSFHSTARSSIGLETAPFIIQHLQLPHIAVGLAAILGKLVLKLCLDLTVKENLIELKGIDAVRAAIGHSQDQLGALRFLVAAEQFLNSPPDSEMPSRPDVADLLLMHHVHTDANENPNDILDSPRSESSSSSLSSEDDEISAELKNETSRHGEETVLPVTPIPTSAASKDNDTSKSPRKSPRADTPVPMDDELAALLEDIEISTSPMASPQQSPVKSKAHHMKVTVTPKAVLDLDDSFTDLDAELEKLKEDDFGGIRALDRFDDLASGSGEHTGSSIASEDATDGSSPDGSSPDDILARIEAIEKMTEELDSMSSSNASASAAEAPSYAEIAALPPKEVPQSLDELDDAMKALEMARTAPSPEPTTVVDSESPRSDDSEETSKVDSTAHSDSEEDSSKTDSDETTASTDSSPVEPIASDLDIIAPAAEKEPEVVVAAVEPEVVPPHVESEPISETPDEVSTPETPAASESTESSTHVEEVTEPTTPVVEEPEATTPVEEAPAQVVEPVAEVAPEVVAVESPVATPPAAEEPDIKAEAPSSQTDKPTVQEAVKTQPETKPVTAQQNGTTAHSNAPSNTKPSKKPRSKGDKTTATTQVGITKQTRAQPVAIYATVGVLLAVMAAAAVSYLL